VPVEALSPESLDQIVSAVDRLTRPVGKGNLAKALRGSRAKSLSRGGLLTLAEYGKLAHYSEPSIVAAIESLITAGRLARAGRKYPTVWMPGKPIRGKRTDEASTGPRKKRSSRYGGPIARALDSYTRRTARRLKWKSYMVLQRKVILAIDRAEPDSHAALERIRGLGPAKIENFGDDILALVREHRDHSA
jgi:superfamily II DNA helicase RecQ